MKKEDLILINGEIITLNNKDEIAEAVAVEDGLITEVGSNEEIKSLADNNMKVIDLKGKTVVPGFIDAHVHFMQTGLDKIFVDLTEADTKQEMLNLLKERAQKKEAGEWIYAAGFDDDKFADKKPPTRWEIDEVVADNPVWCNRIDSHSCTVNSEALELLDIPADMPGVDTNEAREKTGVIRDEANSEVRTKVLGMVTKEKRLKAMNIATEIALEAGITTVHSMEGGRLFSHLDVETLLEKRAENPLYIVVFNQTKDVDRVLDLGLERIGGCIILDGSFGSHTAALLEPYEDDPNTNGKLYNTQEEIDEFILRAHKEGLQATCHAIGDRAIEQLLTAYEKAQAEYPREDARHRIEHSELINQKQIKRANELGVTLSMQPAFEHYWGGLDGMYGTRLGEERAKKTNRYRDILEAGCLLAGGSDSDVTPMNPLLGIHGAVNHSNEEQQLEVKEALKMFTINAAKSVFEEDIKGTIEPEKMANFTVLDKNLLTVPKDEIKDINIEQTIIDGVTYYSSQEG